MKDKIKKIMEWRPGPAWYLGMAVAALLLLLCPLIRLAGYSVPWYDDYNYGSFAKMAMRKMPTVLNALRGAWECIRISWYAWQGTYGSILFMVLMPGIWGENYYRFGPVFLILLLTLAVFVFLYNLSRTVFGGDRVHSAGIGAMSACLTLELLHTAQEGLYWYNGGVHYVGMHAFLLLLLSAMIRMLWGEGRRRYILLLPAVALAALTAGANFVTALQGMLVILTMVAYGAWRRYRSTFLLLPVLFTYSYGFFMNITAPGNDKRAENYVGWGMPAAKAVFVSFTEAGKQAWKFTGFMTLAILFLLLPLIQHMVSRTAFPFPLPGLFSIWSICLYATGFTPSLYSLGHAGLDRTLNAVKLTWQILLVINMIWWCGWICRRREPQHMKNPIKMCRWWFYPIVAILILAAFMAEPNKAGSFSSYGAWYYIHTGEAYNFYEEYQERVVLLKSDETKVGLAPYHWTPWLIYMGDISENPENESNRALADWYGKDEVFLVSEE